jgi:hypothetical protein
MTEISKARQALRDYALTAHAVQLNQVLGCAWVADPPDIPDGLTISISRGEAGAKAFMAVQAALTVAEELRTEADAGDLGRDDLAPDERSGYRLAMYDFADRIEGAILKALEG